MRKTYRWGVIGLGSIAHRFMTGFTAADRAVLQACASRSMEKAKAYQAEFGAVSAYDSYEDLMNDPEVDIVYVATPHPFHLPQAEAALRAGKHVLVEKPACVNLAELERLQAVARETGRFLMEGMWTRLFPTIRQAQAWVADGRIGRVCLAQAAFASRGGRWDPEARILNPMLAGGALLDIGVYTLTWADLFYGTEPTDIAAQAVMTDTGVDAQTAMLMQYPGGGSAMLSCGINAWQKDTGWVWGEKGHIEMPTFWRPDRAVLVTDAGTEVAEFPLNKDRGFRFEVEHVHDCLDKGLTESPVVDFETSRRIQRTTDRVREAIGLRFPCEK